MPTYRRMTNNVRTSMAVLRTHAWRNARRANSCQLEPRARVPYPRSSGFTTVRPSPTNSHGETTNPTRYDAAFIPTAHPHTAPNEARRFHAQRAATSTTSTSNTIQGANQIPMYGAPKAWKMMLPNSDILPSAPLRPNNVIVPTPNQHIPRQDLPHTEATQFTSPAAWRPSRDGSGAALVRRYSSSPSLLFRISAMPSMSLPNSTAQPSSVFCK